MQGCSPPGAPELADEYAGQPGNLMVEGGLRSKGRSAPRYTGGNAGVRVPPGIEGRNGCREVNNGEAGRVRAEEATLPQPHDLR